MMLKFARGLLFALLAVSLAAPDLTSGASIPQESTSSATPAIPIGAPLMFVENVGQFDKAILFQAVGAQGSIALMRDAIWITVFEPTTPRLAPGSPQSELDSLLSPKATP